jgi:D-aminoacyl-tRNA deacylase
MNFAVLASNKDPAALNIASELEALGVKVNYLIEESIYAERVCMTFNEDFLIFISKHRSEKGTNSLTVHTPGNFKEAEFGGQEGKLCPASAFFSKHIFRILNEKGKDSGYQVSLEVTHHGPYLEKPCCFIEIGSSEKQWEDKKAGKIIAATVKEALDTYTEKHDWIPAIGIGGLHYCPSFNRIQLNTSYALGHIIPGYQMPLTAQIIMQAINKTIEVPKAAILDWKGIKKSEDRQMIQDVLKNNKIEIIRSEKIKDKD